jgi:beta-lactamase regulating signal transducer with metallopeptidase domain
MNLILFVVRTPLLLLLLKWTALFALGWIIQLLICRRHPRARMILWRSILCFSLILPLAQFFQFKAVTIPIRSPALTSRPPAEEVNASVLGPVIAPTFATDERRQVLNAQTPEHLNARLVQPRPVQHRIQWKSFLFIVWALGGAFASLRLSRLQVQLARLRKNAAFPNPVLEQLAEKIRSDLGIERSVELRLSALAGSPFICGVAQPTILLPTAMANELSLTDLTALLSHEIAHLRHHDLVWCLGWQCLKVAFWFHPLVWWIPAVHKFACEEEADRIASGQAKDVGVYAQSLARLALRVLSLRALETQLSLNGASQIARRLSRLKQGAIGQWTWKHSLGGGVLATMVCLIAVAPNFSQADERRAAGANRVASAPAPNTDCPGTSRESGASALSGGIHAQVLDYKGNSIANANVECQGFDWRTSTDDHGNFSWNGEKQPRTFQIKKSGYKTLLTGLLIPSEKTTVLTMQRAQAIAGKVIDKETRQPISNLQVYHVRLLQGPFTSLSPREHVIGNAGMFKYSFEDSFWPDSAFYIDAEGYLPVLTPPLTAADDGKELNFELSRSRPVKGEVLSPQGTPAEKAEVRLWCGELNISDIPRRHETESDNHGAFTVPAILAGTVVVYHSSGYAEVPWKEFAANGRVQLSEWGHVKGRWPNPLPSNRRISIERINWSGQMNTYTISPPWKVASTEVHTGGNFEFEEGAPPGEYMLTEWNTLRINHPGGGYSMAVLMSMRIPVLVEPGRTAVVEVPVGRTVVGRLGVDAGQSLTKVHLPIVSLRLKQNEPNFNFPGLDPSLSEAQNFRRWKQYRQQLLEFWLSDHGKALRRAERVYEVPAEPDGSFRIDNVPAGVYELQLNAQRWSGKKGPEIQKEITISGSAEGLPVDLGLLK